MDLVSLFAVPVASAIFALFGSWLGTRWGRANEHKQWLRNERVKVYSEFLTELKEEIRKAEWSTLQQRAPVKFPHVHMARIDVVGSHAVRSAAKEYGTHVTSYELAGRLLAAEPGFLEIPGPNTAKRQQDFMEARNGLLEIGQRFDEVIRKDLRTD